MMLQALWLASGEAPGAGVRALWAGNYFANALEKEERASPGRHAVTRVAWLLVHQSQERRMRNLEHHLVTGAVAVWLSRHATESELKRYLAGWGYFGRGARGVEAAAATYFGKRPSELTVAQVGMLAGLLRSPSRDEPACNPARAVKRRDFVLTRLRDAGVITPEELTAAMSEPFVVLPPPVPCRWP
ncbi:transglycosylase domain-containing protein [Archangium minus]